MNICPIFSFKVILERASETIPSKVISSNSPESFEVDVLSSDFSFFLWEPHPASIPANRVRHNNNTITLYLFITPPAVKTEGQRFSFWVLSFLIHLLQQSLPRKKSSVPQLPLFPFCPLSDMCHLLKACALLMCH